MTGIVLFWLVFFLLVYVFTKNDNIENNTSETECKGTVKESVKLIKRKELEIFLEDKLTPEEKNKLYENFKNRCFKCGSRNRLSIDHHLPLSKGYPLNDKKAGLNAVVLCERCNREKGDALPQKYYKREKLQELEKIGIKSHLYYSPKRIQEVEENLLSEKIKVLEESIRNMEVVRFIYLDQEDLLFIRECVEVTPVKIYSRKEFLYRGWIWQWFLEGEGYRRRYFNIRWIYHLTPKK